MDNNIKLQLKILAETIEQLKQQPGDLDVDGGRKAEEIEKIDVHALEHRINEYIENHQNQELADISRALKSMRLAISCPESTDQNLTRHARKLLKSWCHPVPNLRNSAENFADLLDQLNISEEPNFDNCIQVCDEYMLARIVDIKQLQYVGKVLENCVADYEDANEYMNKYRDGEISIWTLLKEDEPIYLLTVENRDNIIYEFEGKIRRGESTNELPYDLAIGILNQLNVTADHVEEFVQAGAFSRFRNGMPKTIPFEIDGIEFWVWSYRNELIVGIDSNSDGRLSWSHFNIPFASRQNNRRRRRHCYNRIDSDRLLDLAIQSETLMDKLINPTHH